MSSVSVSAFGSNALQALIGLVRTMRVKQWTKNVLIYAGLVFDGQLFVFDPFVRATISFILLCLTASTIYIINDLVDLESDRQHPRKKFRALPSGQLPVRLALFAAVIIPSFSLIAASLLSPQFAIILIVYFLLHVLYSFVLKNVVIIDILTVTAGFVLRVAAGVAVVQVENFSPWLYACTALLALFLVIGKRRQELVMLADNAQNVRVTQSCAFAHECIVAARLFVLSHALAQRTLVPFHLCGAHRLDKILTQRAHKAANWQPVQRVLRRATSEQRHCTRWKADAKLENGNTNRFSREKMS